MKSSSLAAAKKCETCALISEGLSLEKSETKNLATVALSPASWHMGSAAKTYYAYNKMQCSATLAGVVDGAESRKARQVLAMHSGGDSRLTFLWFSWGIRRCSIAPRSRSSVQAGLACDARALGVCSGLGGRRG